MTGSTLWSRIAVSVIFLGFLISIAVALDTVSTGFRVGSTMVTIDAHGTCQNVIASDGRMYFVPTNTAAEWSAFRTNKPSAVTLSECVGWQENARCTGAQMTSGEVRTTYIKGTAKCSPSNNCCDMGPDACSEPPDTAVTVQGMTYSSIDSPNYGGYYFSSAPVAQRSGPSYDFSTKNDCQVACESAGDVCCEYNASGEVPLCTIYSGAGTEYELGGEAYIAESEPTASQCPNTWTQHTGIGSKICGELAYGSSGGAALTRTQCNALCEKVGAVGCIWNESDDQGSHTCSACKNAVTSSFFSLYRSVQYTQVCTPQ